MIKHYAFNFLFNNTKYSDSNTYTAITNTHQILKTKTSMKKIFVLLIATITFAMSSFGQSTANYSFATTTSGSLAVDANANTVDMTTGTTTLVVAGTDDGASAVTNIGFDFWLNGTRFTQFSASSNGLMALGSTAVSTGYVMSVGTAANPHLSAFNADLRAGLTTGKVHYKVVGTAPNRTLVVEFFEMQVFYTATSTIGTSTWQVRLYENPNVVEYVYGTMSVTDVTATNRAPNIGFYLGATTGSFASVVYATQTSSTTAPYAANPNVAAIGPITELTSVANGSRRTYTYTAPIAAAPTNLTFSAVTLGGMTLNWTDNATNEVGYVLYRSTDNISFNFVGQIAANSTSSIQTGLAASTTYYWRVYAVTEGALGTAVTGSQATTACAKPAGTYSVGPTGTYATLTAAIADLNATGLTGPTFLELQAAYTSASETFPITINAIPCLGVANPLTIRPETGATNLSITSANTTATIDINGGNYVTIDGRPGGTGTVKQLTIANTSIIM
jgi:hypothetical protein